MTQIKLRRDTSANFTSKNPVLGVGEPAYETDTKKLKIGDGTTAYTQLEYFSAGGGGSTNITATLPLKIVDGVISLEVDGQTIQIVDGKLHANLDDKQDRFETQIPLSISKKSITTSAETGITETEESWTGGGPDKFVRVNVSALNIDANSDWKIHLSGYMGNFHATTTNSNTLIISTESEQIFRVWFGSRDFRLGNGTNPFKRIPNSDREFFYEIVHQNNGTEFSFNGTALMDSTPLSISTMSREIGGQTPYTTLEGKGKLKEFAFVINSDQFQRIDKDISKSYFEADGAKYPITSAEGINTLKLGVGDGLSVVDGKLTASSTAPTNMVTTDTEQTITRLKTFSAGIKGDGYINNIGLTDLIYTDINRNPHVGNKYRTLTIHTNPVDNGKILVNTGSANYEDLHTGNIANFVDGTSITFTNNKLSATGGGSAPTNMVTTDTAQTISGDKTLTGITTISNDMKFTIGKKITTPDGQWLMQLGAGFIGIGTSMKPLQTYDGSNYYLHNKSVIAGDGIEITEPSSGEIQISSTIGNMAAYVIEEFVDGTEGYRVWSNGYCEQWGYKSGTTPETITFLKAFKDTNYNVTMATEKASVYFSTNFNTKTTTSMNIAFTGGNGGSALGASWRVAGYIA